MARLSPSAVLEELLRFRPSTLSDTKWFRAQKHNDDLCPAVNDRVNEILDCFVKYHAISYDVQGLRDQGVDVVMQYAAGDDVVAETVVAIQIKSFLELERGGVARDLKTQFMDARRRYGERLERYYVMLCTDAEMHRDRLRDIAAELSAEKQIRIIEPRFAFTFLHLSSTTVSGTVDRLLRNEDAVQKAARSEVSDLSPLALAIVLDALVFQRSPRDIELGASRPTDLIVQTATSCFDGVQMFDVIKKTYLKLEDSAFKRVDLGWELPADAFRALRCIMLDAEIRFGYSGRELFDYMFEIFHQSALGEMDPDAYPQSDDWAE